ncbi:acylphosphatase [Limobrevibacterium gyesilva]|uniref:acylphosphatase n=1 Tax=Limobrevibacterium gyesilva TaxID=2991712 RepID=A0AA42CCZ1_9PROT|nr:acylphosphatase [Limobrevibacterium gyesilva]MCW3472984.1 acylphosphatase [Limobrevibacterium gyesilva]
MSTLRLVISGRVQGVGYRAWMADQAQALGLSGWVRNRSDGTVEALVAGDDDAVAELLRASRLGPRLAVVTEIVEELAEPPELPGFRSLPTI